MDDVGRFPPRDRADLFAQAARRGGLRFETVEKDFWVCWSLKRLFTLEDPPAGLLFKGGTSLSKVFKVIERFSEDVDLSFDRAALGFGGENDPLVAPSGKKQKRGVDALVAACKKLIHETFYPALHRAFAEALGESATSGWRLEFAEDDPDRQTFLFHYPIERARSGGVEPSYVRPTVRLEFGARSDHWPAVDAEVRPYAAEQLPHLFRAPGCTVRALSAERTFWEKATVLHMWHYAPPEKHFRDRQSRHYYDLTRLWENGPGKSAATNTSLLGRVAEHKSVFFAAAWARYDLARPGTLKLVPPDTRLAELEGDYRKMREMIFGTPPEFEAILAGLRKIEAVINGSAP